jgi:hypothetical protein
LLPNNQEKNIGGKISLQKGDRNVKNYIIDDAIKIILERHRVDKATLDGRG